MKLPLIVGLASMITLVLSPTDAQCQIQPRWSMRANAGPSPRTGQCMSYDSARGVTVLFGGWSGSMALGDTWEWNGRTWSLRNVIGPSPRAGAMMAFDSVRHVTVLFGGVAGTTNFDDTWEWNGVAWTLSVGITSRPPGRSSGALIFDSARNVFVLFGGTNGGNLGDTWEYNGSWIQRSTTGPSPRHAVAMAYDTHRHETVLFGSSTVTNDTWIWDGAVWTQRTVVSPPRSRGAAAMAYDSARERCVLFGGDGNTIGTDPLGDTWEWDGTAWALRATTGPSRRFGHSMAYDSGRGVTLLFGGYSGSAPTYGDTWGYYCAADLDDGSGMGIPDGGVTVDDLLYYIGIFAQGIVRADLDDGSGTGVPDGGVTIDDLLYYLFRFEQGC